MYTRNKIEILIIAFSYEGWCSGWSCSKVCHQLFASFSRRLRVLDFEKWLIIELTEGLDWDLKYHTHANLMAPGLPWSAPNTLIVSNWWSYCSYCWGQTFLALKSIFCTDSYYQVKGIVLQNKSRMLLFLKHLKSTVECWRHSSIPSCHVMNQFGDRMIVIVIHQSGALWDSVS